MAKQTFLVITATDGEYFGYPEIITKENLATEEQKAKHYTDGEFHIKVLYEFELDTLETRG